MKSIMPYKTISQDIIILFISRIISSVGSFVLPFLSLLFTKELGFTSSTAGVYITIITMCYIPGNLLGGVLADRFNTRNVLILSQVVSAACLILITFTNHIYVRVFLLIISFIIAGMIYPCIDTLVTRSTEGEDRKRAFSLMYIGFNIGYAIGPVLGGFLISKNINYLFIGDGLTTMAAAGLVSIFISNKSAVAPKVQNVEKQNTKTFHILSAKKILIAFIILCAFFNFIYAQYTFTLPLSLNSTFGFTTGAKYYGLLISVNSIFVIFFTPIITKILGKMSSITNMIFSGLFFLVGFGSYYYSINIILLIISTILWSVGEILFSVNSIAYVTEKSPSTHVGRICSTFNAVSRIGMFSAPMISGVIISYLGTSSVWIVVAITTSICVAFTAGIKFIDRDNSANPGLDI